MEFLLLAEATCTSDITTCCSDYGLATYFHIVQKALDILHLFVPIILIIMATINIIQLLLGPDDPQKKKTKSLINKFIAAVIVFFVPIIVNVLFNLIPDGVDFGSCWKAAEDIYNTFEEVDYNEYEENKNTESYSSSSWLGKGQEFVKNAAKQYASYSNNRLTGKAQKFVKNAFKMKKQPSIEPDNPNDKRGEAVVSYAKNFIGGRYVYGGTSLQTGVDCSGFTQQVYKHFGITIPRTSQNQAKFGEKISSLASAKPGDLLFYCGGNGCSSTQVGHVALYEGNGKIIHASCPTCGIIEGNANYKRILGIRRVIK